jgi:malate dehydrogenase
MTLKRPKIAVIGGGNVGATTAHLIALKNLADVIVVDIVQNLPQGKMLDLGCSAPVEGFDVKVTGSNDYAAIAGADVVVHTAGVPRKPGMSRDDLVDTNARIARSVGESIRRYAPESIVVVVANPLDAITYVISEVTGFPKNRVMGQAGVLDSARFRSFIAWELGVSVDSVQGFVLGGHGDTMVPVPSLCSVGGVPVTRLIPKDRLDAIVQRARDGGAEVVKLLGTSAWYAPASCTVEMVEAIVNDRKKVLPTAAYLDGEYGLKGLFIGVQAVLGASGVEKIWEVPLSEEELSALHQSAKAVEELVGVVKKLGVLS